MIYFGDKMNTFEIELILSKMIDKTHIVMIDLEVSCVKNRLSIDKNIQ